MSHTFILNDKLFYYHEHCKLIWADSLYFIWVPEILIFVQCMYKSSTENLQWLYETLVSLTSSEGMNGLRFYIDPIYHTIQGRLWSKWHSRFLGTHVAQPRSIGQNRSAVSAHFVIAHLTLGGENCHSTQRLKASATNTLAVFSTATFGSFSLDIQQLSLKLPEIKQTKRHNHYWKYQVHPVV